MKKNQFISIAFLLSLIVLASCSKRGDYINVLPKDAKVVVAIDGKAIVEKVRLSEDNMQKLQNKILQLVGTGLNAEDYKKVEAGVKSPSELGLSLTDKIFVFSTTGSKQAGVLMKVNDEDKIKDFMDILSRQLGQKIEEKDDCSFLRENDYMLATNGSALLLMTVGKKQDEAVKYMTVLLKQTAEESYAKSEYFKKLNRQKGEVTAVGQLSALSASYTSFLLPGDAKPDEVYAVAGLLFEKGRVSIEGECFTTNTELKAKIDSQKGAFDDIKGRFTKSLPLNTPIVIAMHVNGEKAFSFLDSGGDLFDSLLSGIGLDTESFLKAIDGDMIAGISNISMTGESDATVMTEAKSAEPLSDIKETLQMTGRLKTTAPNCYSIPLSANKLCYFGFKNGILYYTSDGVTSANIGEKVKENISSAPWCSKMEKSNCFAVLNTEALMQSGSFRQMMSRNPQSAQMAMAFQDVKYIDVSIADKGKFSFEMVMKDHSVNVLEKLVTMLALL